MAQDNRHGPILRTDNSPAAGASSRLAEVPYGPAHARTLKERAAEHWARRQLGRIEHERRVLAIASKLFDLTARLHRLDRSHRRTLRMAALLHDVGRRFGEKNHPSDGARMIEEDGYLPLAPRQRRAVVYLTRYHRGAVPRLGYDGILRRGDGRKDLLIVLALLRAADALDSRQLDPPVLSLALRGRRLSITCFIEEDCPKSRKTFRRRKKFRLLEEMLRMRVEVEVRQAETVEHV
jgi:exopolyphosphatase/guanosine-5'-triphosphate,3'-diphosphate pyrophosphatase